MTFLPEIQAEVSVNNSTSEALGIDGVFTGTSDDVTQSATISVFIETDQKGTIACEFSTDEVTWTSGGTATVLANVARSVEATVVAQFFRVIYTNGAIAQTVLKLQSILSPRRNKQITKNFNNVLDVGFDTVPNTKLVEVCAHTDALSATEETIWDEGGNYVFPASAATLTVSSDSTSDAPASSGALTVCIIYLDANLDEQTEVVTMNGTTGVTTVGSILRVNEIAVVSSGSTNANVGIIYIGTGGLTGGKPATVYGLIAANVGVSRVGIYTVPNNKTASFMSCMGSVNSLDEIVQVVFNLDLPTNGNTIWKLMFLNFNDGTKILDLSSTRVFPATTDLILSGKTITAAVTPEVDIFLTLMVTDVI